jgi:hypothetical protein
VLFEKSLTFPKGEVSETGGPRREVVRELSPSATRLADVADSVKDFAGSVLRREETKATADGRKELLGQLPLLIGPI